METVNTNTDINKDTNTNENIIQQEENTQNTQHNTFSATVTTTGPKKEVNIEARIKQKIKVENVDNQYRMMNHLRRKQKLQMKMI